MTSKKQRQKEEQRKGVMYALVILLVFVSLLARHPAERMLLRYVGTCITTQLTADVGGGGRNGPSTRLYSFYWEGKMYEGNSFIEDREKKLVGERIMVVFWKSFPSVNYPQSYIHCDCDK